MTRPSTSERDAKYGDGGWITHRLYGLTLASNFAFANRLAPGMGSPDLTFAHVRSAPLLHGWEQTEPAYTSPYRTDSGKRAILLYRLDDCLVLRYPTADYYLWNDRIVCHLSDPRYCYLVEIQLLGVVLACWLEQRGIPALHASAVVVDDRAVAFLATSGGGKSSLAATLMQAGHPLLTDDILPVERSDGAYVGHYGYPQVRMWPDQAQHFLGHYEDLGVVHPAYSKRRVPVGEVGFGTFCDTSRSLACLYLPERRDPAYWGTRVEITPLSPLEGLMRLIGSSIVAPLVEALGLHADRLGFLGPLVSRIPIRRVAYPSGFEHLPRVRRAILNDLAGLPSSCGEDGWPA